MPDLDYYLGLIPPYNAGQPDFMTVLSTLLDPLTQVQGFIGSISDAYDLDVAVGVQLDVDGIWIGRSRYISVPITNVYFSWDIDNLGWEQGYWQGAFDPDDGVSRLDDATYRQLLYAKAAANHSDGSLDAAINIMNELLTGEGVSATVYDNQDMSMTLEIHGVIQNLLFHSIITGGYIPIKPAGVALNYLVVNPVQYPVSITITGLGGVQASAHQLQFASATIHGQGSIGVGGFVASFIPLVGTGHVIASAVSNLLGRATIGAVGSVSAVAYRMQSISATIGGQGSVNANANVPQPAFVLGMNGLGTATATARLQMAGTATIAGAGSVTAQAIEWALGTATIAGVGVATASAVWRSTQNTATIAGAGSISANAVTNPFGAVTIAGAGSVSATANVRLLGAATIGGAGGVSANATVSVFGIRSNIHVGLAAWSNHTFALAERCSNAGNAYQCITAGTSTSAPTGTAADIAPGGTAHFKWLSAIDYTTLQAWSDGMAATLAAPVTGLVWNDGPILCTLSTILLNLTGHTTSSTNTITLTCAAGESFRDQPSSTAGTTTPSKGVTIQGPSSGTPSGAVSYIWINDQNVIVDGIQFYDPLSTSQAQAMIVWTPAVRIQGCIFDGYTQSGAGTGLLDLAPSTSGTIIENCLFIDRAASSPRYALYAQSSATVVNCTFVSLVANTSVVAINEALTAANSLIVKNCAVMGWSSPVGNDGATVGSVADHCVFSGTLNTSVATDGGNNLNTRTAANQFVSATVDFRLKTGADCINAGTTDTTHIPLSDDFFRTHRPLGLAWDVGCFESA